MNNTDTPITLKPVTNSSLIAADGWSDDRSILRVRFRNGREYEYRGLTPHIHSEYTTAESKGRYLKGKIEPYIQGVEI